MDDFSIGDEVSFVITPNCDKVIHILFLKKWPLAPKNTIPFLVMTSYLLIISKSMD